MACAYDAAAAQESESRKAVSEKKVSGSLIQAVPVIEKASVGGPAFVVGLDFGLCAPGEEFIYACVYLNDGNTLRRVFDAFIDTSHELSIGERAIGPACSL